MTGKAPAMKRVILAVELSTPSISLCAGRQVFGQECFDA